MFAGQLLSLSLFFIWVLPSLAFPYKALDFAEEGIVTKLAKRLGDPSNTNLPPFTPKTWPYQRPAKDASRTPCPLVNAVANHGFVLVATPCPLERTLINGYQSTRWEKRQHQRVDGCLGHQSQSRATLR